jgi:hypothetical protein
MSKIMRALYAEARAAREVAALTNERAEGGALDRPSASDPIKASSIAWWEAQYAQAGRGLVDICASNPVCWRRPKIDPLEARTNMSF